MLESHIEMLVDMTEVVLSVLCDTRLVKKDSPVEHAGHLEQHNEDRSAAA